MTDDPRVFGGRYELIRHIARGGMARVYLARDLLLDRPVALKVLFPELSVDDAFVQRFRREAQAAANLAHPNIVSIYDWGQGERTYFIVMEYVDGETLSARIRRGALSADQAAIVGISTAAALAFAHRRNVIHRDVKPGNVLIDRSGQVKVADFGIARAVGTSEDLTQAGAVMGTATYFSPEQAQGQAVDARSDVYSLGVVLYEMAAGRPPFQGDTPVAIAYKHVREAPTGLRVLDPGIPAAYEAIALKALAKDPDARYQSADQLRADLERFRAGRPVDAAAGGTATTVLTPAAVATTSLSRPVEHTTVTPAVAHQSTALAGPPAPPPPASGEPRGGHAGRWVVAIVVLLAALAVLVFLLGRDVGLFGGTKTLTVPSVRNQTSQAAKAELRSRGFTSVGVDHVTSTVGKGRVVGTDPRAGSRIHSDAHLELEVSAGPATIPVPPVGGDTKTQAKQALHARGFKVTVSYSSSPSVHVGYAIRTDPPAGNRVAKGIRVQLVVSSGPADVAIPPLTGDLPAVAGGTLSGDKLTVGPTKYKASSSVTSGEVIGTSPPAGALVLPGTTVTIYVSSGPAKVAVPDVVGDTKSAASAKLTAKHLTPSFTTVPVTSPGEAGLVQTTNPQPGVSVQTGTQVVVALGVYTAPPTTTSTSTTTTTTTTLPVSPTTLPAPTTVPGSSGEPGARAPAG